MLMKSPKGFKPVDSHQNWLQAPVELHCTLCICVVLFARQLRWDRSGPIYKDLSEKMLLIEVDFSPISDQPGAFPGCDLCLSLKF